MLSGVEIDRSRLQELQHGSAEYAGAVPFFRAVQQEPTGVIG
jgi:hypothetical protein